MTKAVLLRSQFSPPMPQPRVPVVIAIEADGFLRAYAPENVSLRFVQVLRSTTTDNRTLAEEYAALRLPAAHREIAFDARHSRGVFMPFPRTPKKELESVIALSMLQEVRR